MGFDRPSHFTPEQERAIESFSRSTVLLAGAGSGKTSVLVERYFRCLENGANPFQILAVTFTVDAADQLKDRIHRRIEQADLSPDRKERLLRELRSTPYIGTLHAFCYRVVEQWGTLLGLARLSEILTPFHYAEVFDRHFSDWQGSLDEATLARLLDHLPQRQLRELLFDCYPKRERFNACREVADDDTAWMLSRCREFWQKIDADLHGRGIYGFDDLETFAVRLLTQFPEVRSAYQEKLRYFFIDEFQDTSPAQWQILRAISEHRPEGLFLVGDPKQSIYRFRNADYRVFLAAGDWIQSMGGEKLELTTNFRSCPPVLESINRLSADLFRDSKIPYQPMEPGRREAEDCGSLLPYRIARVPGGRAELVNSERAQVLSSVRALLSHGVPPKEIAVLFRVSERIAEYFDEFLKEDIPVVAKTVQAVFQNYDTLDLTAYLYAVAHPLDDYRLAAFLRGRFCRWSLSELQEAWLSPGKTLFEKVASKPSLQWFFETLNSGETIVESLLERLFSGTDYFPQSHATVMEWMTPLVTEPTTALEALEKIESWKRNGIRSTLSSGAEHPNAVQLLTVHSAKGLEFDEVLLVDNLRLPPRQFPVFLSEGNRFGVRWERNGKTTELLDYTELLESHRLEDLEESRRVLYVAVTRARKGITVFLPESRELIPKNTWGEWLDL